MTDQQLHSLSKADARHAWRPIALSLQYVRICECSREADRHQGFMGVTTQGAALVYVVLLYERQQQHSINVANVQVLNLGWDAITLRRVARVAPCVQVRLHSWCYDLQKGQS